MLKLFLPQGSRQIVVFEGEFWFFSQELSAEEGLIRSISEGDVSVPQQGWQYFNPPNTDINCTTVR